MGRKEQTDMEEICLNCEHSTFIANTENCICSKKGVVRADGRCCRFKADLLKVEPAKSGILKFVEKT